MKTQQYYKDITFTFIKIFDIKLASWINETGNFCSWQNNLYFANLIFLDKVNWNNLHLHTFI